MTRTHLWFLIVSIIFVSMMAGLMPGEQKNQYVHGRMILSWHGNYSSSGESFSEETWMPTCYLLQRAASRASDTEHEGIRVSCDEQAGGAPAMSGLHSPRARGAGLLQRRDDFDVRRDRAGQDRADCRSDQCDNLKKLTNIGLNAR
jgi:hypothetical protein